VARLVNRLLSENAERSKVPLNSADWLFPGRQPGRSLHPHSLARRLTALGIEVRSARNSALLDYARQLPPTVIGQLLGFSPTTMERWAALSGGKWARYSPSLPDPLAHRSLP
jgi:hypothetical protein